MAAGGPIIDPRVDAFVIIPMAAFKFGARPLVVPATSRVHIEMVKPKPCLCVIDGQQERPLEGDEAVEMFLSSEKAKFISFERDFYKKMTEKLVCSL